MTTESPKHSNKEEIYELILAYQKNPDEEVKTKLVLHYEELVHHFARRFSRGDDLYEDLVQVGMIGLLGALSRFDMEYGRTFESFAVPTIIGEMKRYIRDKTWSVHVPRRIKEIGPKIKSAVEELTTINQRSPLMEEIADYLGVSTEEVLEALEMGRNYNALSVDSSVEPDFEGGRLTLLDVIGNPENGYDTVNKRMVLEKLFQVLNDREQEILKLIFFEGLSQKEAGQRLEISQMHVSRLQRRALEKLKKHSTKEYMELLN